jgi:hypothetical protein
VCFLYVFCMSPVCHSFCNVSFIIAFISLAVGTSPWTIEKRAVKKDSYRLPMSKVQEVKCGHINGTATYKKICGVESVEQNGRFEGGLIQEPPRWRLRVTYWLLAKPRVYMTTLYWICSTQRISSINVLARLFSYVITKSQPSSESGAAVLGG